MASARGNTSVEILFQTLFCSHGYYDDFQRFDKRGVDPDEMWFAESV
jgi:hypothetical protein